MLKIDRFFCAIFLGLAWTCNIQQLHCTFAKESAEIMVCLPGIDFGDQQQPFYLLRESVIVDLIDLCGCHDMSRKQFG